MALAEKLLAAEFNKPGLDIVDHHTYAFVGDGCLMEGISHEACSLAGTLGLNKLIVLYDDNGISIDGNVEGWFSDDTPKRFEAYGWNVIRDVDGHDVAAVDAAIAQAQDVRQADPDLLQDRDRQGLAEHGRAATRCTAPRWATRKSPPTREAWAGRDAPFEIPADVYAAWDAERAAAHACEARLEHACSRRTSEQYPAGSRRTGAPHEGRTAGQFRRAVLEAAIASCVDKKETIATRKASQNAIQALAPALPEFLGGSADLTGSNLTNWKECVAVRADQPGNHINYGVREFGMSAIMNGIALHGGFIPFGATFLTFSDYSRNALRMAALMKIRSMFVFTHDSIGLGEDGPTHQSVEHVSQPAPDPEPG